MVRLDLGVGRCPRGVGQLLGSGKISCTGTPLLASVPRTSSILRSTSRNQNGKTVVIGAKA